MHNLNLARTMILMCCVAYAGKSYTLNKPINKPAKATNSTKNLSDNKPSGDKKNATDNIIEDKTKPDKIKSDSSKSEQFIVEKPKTINSHEMKKQDRRLNVLLSDSGTAIIQDIRKIKLDKGVSQINVTDVPFSVINDNLLIKSSTPNVDILNYEYRQLNKPFIELLKTMVGKTISYKIGGEIFSGRLININKDGAKDIIIVSRKGGYDVVSLHKCEYLNLQNSMKQSPEELSDSNLVVNVQAKEAGEAEIELGYTLDGLCVDLLYIIETSKKLKEFPIQAAAIIMNNTNIDFENVTLTFSSVLDKRNKEKITIRTDKLNSGKQKVIALKKIENQKMFITYQVKVPKDFDGDSIDLKARRILSIKCPFILKRDTGKSFKTKALLKIDQKNQFYSSGSSMVENSDFILFDAGLSDNVVVHVKKTNVRSLFDSSKDVSFFIKPMNNTTSEIDLSIVLDLGAKYDIIKGNMPRYSNRPEWKLLVPPKETKDFFCRVKFWE